jgi:HAD superfamily hydrolase (TIGR01484 family)
MRAHGVEFVPATGRTLSEIPKELIESPAVRYVITSDGAAVWDKCQKKMILTHYIPEETVHFILDTLAPYNTYILTHESGVNHYDKKKHNTAYMDKCRVGQYFRDIINASAAAVEDYDTFLKRSEAIEMFCVFFESAEAMRECKRIFIESGILCAAQSSDINLEVYMASAGKGKTLAAFADALNVDISDVIAVGDSNNDEELVKTAGLGLAVENATDALKAIADRVICKNCEHSAKYIFENFIDG